MAAQTIVFNLKIMFLDQEYI